MNYHLFDIHYGGQDCGGIDDSLFIIPAFTYNEAEYILRKIHKKSGNDKYVKEEKYLGVLSELIMKDKDISHYEYHVSE